MIVKHYYGWRMKLLLSITETSEGINTIKMKCLKGFPNTKVFFQAVS